eukprot:scaffold35605_cov13-Prasinocladus_malaysianus.AAC.1
MKNSELCVLVVERVRRRLQSEHELWDVDGYASGSGNLDAWTGGHSSEPLCMEPTHMQTAAMPVQDKESPFFNAPPKESSAINIPGRAPEQTAFGLDESSRTRSGISRAGSGWERPVSVDFGDIRQVTDKELNLRWTIGK